MVVKEFVSSLGVGTTLSFAELGSAARLGLEQEPILFCPVFPVSVRDSHPSDYPDAKPHFHTRLSTFSSPLLGFCTFAQPMYSTWVISLALFFTLSFIPPVLH